MYTCFKLQATFTEWSENRWRKQLLYITHKLSIHIVMYVPNKLNQFNQKKSMLCSRRFFSSRAEEPTQHSIHIHTKCLSWSNNIECFIVVKKIYFFLCIYFHNTFQWHFLPFLFLSLSLIEFSFGETFIYIHKIYDSTNSSRLKLICNH